MLINIAEKRKKTGRGSLSLIINEINAITLVHEAEKVKKNETRSPSQK